MRRALFGEWGTGLDDDAFACAVAACGVLHARPRRARGASPGAAPGEASLADALRSAAGDETLVAWRFPSDRMLRAGGAFSGAAELADAWRAFRDSRPPLLRLALDPSTVAPTGVAAADLPALLQVLAHPAARVDAAFVAWRPGQRAAWKWPLRLGLLDDAKSAEVGVRVGALYPARDLSRAFRLCRDEGQCDVAVLPGSPRTSLARILASPVGERAGLVLFTGGCAGAAAQDHAVLQMIADEMRASGIAALSKPLPDPGLFVNDLINHLSHNMPLDVALFLAARDADAGPPILFLDPRFVERSQLASVARAMARKLERAGATPVAMTRGLSERIGVPPSAPVTARAAGKALRRSIPDFGFAGESHEATALARANPAVEAALAEANAGRRDPRYVQTQVERIAAGRSERVEQALVAGERACVKVRIGPDDAAWLNPVNRVPFPDELLPVDEDEHRLTVTLSEPHHLSEPLVASVTMGQTGASSVAHFELVPRPGQPPFRARITVTHRNRVLQTALLRARVLEPGEAPSADDRVTVEVEAVVRPLLHDLAGRRRFDVALAVNHTDQGQPTMLGLADDHAVLRGMTSIAAKLDAISKRLSVVAASSKRYAKGLEDDEGVDLLRFLANKGRDLYDFLIHDQADPVLGERLRNADYVQIVSLSPDAYFPAEFLYEFAVPADDAQVCPAALQALKNDDDSKICTAKDHQAAPNPHVCPFGFWGLRRVIERHAWRAVENAPAGDYVLQAEPSSARRVLELANVTLFAASSHVDDERPGAVQELFDGLRSVFKTPVERAAKWEDWTQLVKTRGPHALIALPHAEERQEYGDTEYYLEVGGDMLKAAAIARSHVLQADDAPAPLVILLGCNTAIPQSAIDSFVGRFRRAGAGIVVGTVASVLGSHASLVAREIAAQIVGLAAGKEVPFGDLLLAARRRALGRGVVMAMCVGGFGDADWLVKT